MEHAHPTHSLRADVVHRATSTSVSIHPPAKSSRPKRAKRAHVHVERSTGSLATATHSGEPTDGSNAAFYRDVDEKEEEEEEDTDDADAEHDSYRPLTSPMSSGLSPRERERWNTRMEVRWEMTFTGTIQNCAAPIFLWAASFFTNPVERLAFLRMAVAYYHEHNQSRSRLITRIRAEPAMCDPSASSARVYMYIQCITDRIASLLRAHSDVTTLKQWCASSMPWTHAFRALLQDTSVTLIELVVCIATDRGGGEGPGEGSALSNSPGNHILSGQRRDGRSSSDGRLMTGALTPLSLVAAAADEIQRHPPPPPPPPHPHQPAFSTAFFSSPPRNQSHQLQEPYSPPPLRSTEIDASLLGVSPLRNPLIPFDHMLARSSPTECAAETMISVSLSPAKESAPEGTRSPSTETTPRTTRMRPRPLVHVFSAQREVAKMTAWAANENERTERAANARAATERAAALSYSPAQWSTMHAITPHVSCPTPSMRFTDNVFSPSLGPSHFRTPIQPVAPTQPHGLARTSAPTTTTMSSFFSSITSSAEYQMATAPVMEECERAEALALSSATRTIIQELYDRAHNGRLYPPIVSVANELLHDAYVQPHAPHKIALCRLVLHRAAETLGIAIDRSGPLHLALRTLSNDRSA